jgi:hypothetical protein
MEISVSALTGRMKALITSPCATLGADERKRNKAIIYGPFEEGG